MAASTDPLFNMLANTLQSIGLGELVSVGRDGEPQGWLWNQIQAGFDTEDELLLALSQTDVFKDRFAVIGEQQKRAAAGQPVRVMTPAEVLEYENRARQMMSAAGMPSWFYDEPDDFNQLILNDISVVELGERIEQAFEYVDNAPEEVRSKFSEFYGVAQSDAALAAYVLDPTKTTAQLEKSVRTAYTAGMAKRFDLELGKLAAQKIAELPNTEAGIVQGLTQIASQRKLFENQLFEDGSLSAETTGVGAVFEGDADALRELERRKATRSMGNQAATGGAVLTQRGLTGAGSSGGG